MHTDVFLVIIPYDNYLHSAHIVLSVSDLGVVCNVQEDLCGLHHFTYRSVVPAGVLGPSPPTPQT